MNKETVFSEVAKRLNVEEANLTMETRFKEDLKADSLDLVELIMEIEEDFGFEISDEEAASIKTISDLVDVAATK